MQINLLCDEDVSHNTCKYWYRQFKAGDFDLSDVLKHRENWPMICKNIE